MMTPNGTVTVEGVKLMILEGIEKYDIGNSKRHAENTAKMDRIMSLLWKMLWAIILVGLTAGAGIMTDIIIHLTGKS